MKYILIQFMFLPIMHLWNSHNIIHIYKLILTPILILYIPIGFFIGLITIFIIFPLIKLYFKLRISNKKRKRKKNYR